jgi:hypothetical protein
MKVYVRNGLGGKEMIRIYTDHGSFRGLQVVGRRPIEVHRQLIRRLPDHLPDPRRLAAQRSFGPILRSSAAGISDVR